MKQMAEGSAANPGLVRPPLVFAFAIVVGFLIDLFYPAALSLGYSAKIAAGFFLIGGAGLFFWTRSAFKEAGTAIAGNKPATHLIQGGPFRFSRNPMYVAFALLYLSVASWSGNLWIFGALTAALWVISKIVIPREECFMKTKFGASYEAYSSRVRRWM